MAFKTNLSFVPGPASILRACGPGLHPEAEGVRGLQDQGRDGHWREQAQGRRPKVIVFFCRTYGDFPQTIFVSGDSIGAFWCFKRHNSHGAIMLWSGVEFFYQCVDESTFSFKTVSLFIWIYDFVSSWFGDSRSHHFCSLIQFCSLLCISRSLYSSLVHFVRPKRN